MTKAISHRGPDDKGFFTSDQLSLGHCRLSVIDLSLQGRQPMFNEDKSVVLAYNGEIFNFQDIKGQLIKKGHNFKSETDSEVIVHAYEEWGIEAVRKFRGFFAFVLWDKKKETLYLARDRIGVKPLYYYQDDGGLFFASEIKAILENKKIKREINESAYYQYLAFQASLGEETLFKGIKKVPPATILTFRKGKLSFWKYWQLTFDQEIRAFDQEALCRRFKQLLLESIRIRLTADVPLGVLLSGGLDSSSVVALMSQLTTQPINTFSVGFGEPDDELRYARIIARQFKTNHQELMIKPKDIQKVLMKIIWHQDEPLADGGGFATYLVAQTVSQYAKVVLIGEGGDELFGGYSWYKLGLPCFSFIPERIRRGIYFYLTTLYRKENCQGVDQFHNFSQVFDAQPGDFLSKMIRFEIENILPNSLCMKVDKMTSAWGLEAREPFLDHKLIEFCFSLPVEYKVGLSQSKLLFRKVMADYLPDEILKRKKHGFLLPTEKWLERGLGNFAREVLFDQTSHARKLYSVKELEELFQPQKFLQELSRSNLLWRLLVFELWNRIYCK